LNLYGYLPTKYTGLKSFDLNWDGSDLGTQTISTSADELSFAAAWTAFNSALGANTGGDLGLTSSNSRFTIASATAKNFIVTNWKARGFFGFDYRIDQANGLGGVPGGLQEFEGLTLEQTTVSASKEEREIYGDQYHFHAGRVHRFTGFVRPENLRSAHMVGKGMKVDPGWAAWKGKVEIIDPNSANSGSAWSFAIPDGYIIGHLASFEIRGTHSVNGAELFEVGLEITT